MADPYIDMKYIRLLSTQLRNYKEKKNNLINFSCPICGDSEKDKLKARGYIYEKQNKYQYKCHNCNVGMSAGNLIKAVNPELWKEWKAEKFKSKYKPKPKFNNSLFKNKPKILDYVLGMESLDKLDDDHVAVRHRISSVDEKYRLPERVNSFHSWGITATDIADELKPIGFDSVGNIEAFVNEEKGLLGVMWHPEREDPYKKLDSELIGRFIS